jgi:predicted Fe-S protein YdhL (DUF1289 family)
MQSKPQSTITERNSSKSPCKGICNLDFETHQVCQGCGRTIDEIANWSIYTNEDKMLINEKATQRLQGF